MSGYPLANGRHRSGDEIFFLILKSYIFNCLSFYYCINTWVGRSRCNDKVKINSENSLLTFTYLLAGVHIRSSARCCQVMPSSSISAYVHHFRHLQTTSDDNATCVTHWRSSSLPFPFHFSHHHWRYYTGGGAAISMFKVSKPYSVYFVLVL